MSDSRDREYEVRESLLDYYNSQADSHATGFLTMAVIGFALVELHLPRNMGVPALSIAVAVFFRMVCTTYYWDRMADAIIRVRRDRGELEMKESKAGNKEDPYMDNSLESLVLHYAATNWVRNHDAFFFQFNSVKRLRSWVPIVLLLTVVGICLWYSYNYLFPPLSCAGG